MFVIQKIWSGKIRIIFPKLLLSRAKIRQKCRFMADCDGQMGNLGQFRHLCPMKKRVFCTVTNDLNYDQRMIRICTSLAGAGFSVVLVGRESRGSLPLAARPYGQHRLKMWWGRGKLFYAEYQIRLLFFLLFR